MGSVQAVEKQDMALHRNIEHGVDRGPRRGSGFRPHDDAPDPSRASHQKRPERPLPKSEPVFDIADFAAIADFAGIGPGGRKGG
jgi:hypothetical protein